MKVIDIVQDETADYSLPIMMALANRPKGERLLTIFINAAHTNHDGQWAIRECVSAIGRAMTYYRGMRINMIHCGVDMIIETEVEARNHVDDFGQTMDLITYQVGASPTIANALDVVCHGKRDPNFFVPRTGEHENSMVVFLGVDFGDFNIADMRSIPLRENVIQKGTPQEGVRQKREIVLDENFLFLRMTRERAY